jgi:zinc transporter ZupT
MQNQGWSKKKILVLWGSLMVITAIGAGFGYLLGGILSHTWLVFTEGVAAGAMLTMIASALIPEAAHLGSPNLVGLSTSGGFITALLFKLLE